MIELINSYPSEVKAEIFASQPIIAVLDSGFDVEHPALKDQVYVNTSTVGVLWKNDTYGCNTTTDFDKDGLGTGDVFILTSGFGETCPGQDGNCYHGTHVAGLAAGDQLTEEFMVHVRFAGLCLFVSLADNRCKRKPKYRNNR